MTEVNKKLLSNFKIKVSDVTIDVIENIEIEEQVVALVIMPGSVTDKRASYYFEGGVTFSGEQDEISEFEFYVPFYGSAQASVSENDISLELSLDEPMNEYLSFIDEHGEEEELTVERLFELVKDTDDYEDKIHSALPSLNSLIIKAKSID